MKKLLLLITTLFLLGLTTPVQAFEYKDRESQGIPASETVIKANVYLKPSKVIITRIDATDRTLEDTPEKWIQYIYYYLESRLGFTDIPYSYFVDKSGEIYQGKSGFEGAVPELINSEGVISIGYLSNTNELTSAASRSLRTMITEFSRNYGIQDISVNAAALGLIERTDQQPAKVNYQAASSALNTEVEQLKQTISFASDETFSYDISIEELKYNKEVKAGEKLQVSFNLKNNGDTPMFIGDGEIFLMTANGSDSQFAVNGVWDSFKEVLSLEPGAILPDESLPVQFEMQALLLPGEAAQSFKLGILGTGDLENTTFNVNFNIVKGEFNLVEIIETETGTLNVRENPAFNGKVLGQVEVGRIVVMTGEQDGWVKIKYSDTLEGWVLGRYTRKL